MCQLLLVVTRFTQAVNDEIDVSFEPTFGIELFRSFEGHLPDHASHVVFDDLAVETTHGLLQKGCLRTRPQFDDTGSDLEHGADAVANDWPVGRKCFDVLTIAKMDSTSTIRIPHC